MIFNNIVYALLAGILPALVWLWFWLREDNLHPEPRSLIAICFIAGCISVIVALFLERFAQEFITDTTLRYRTWSAIEEIIKFIAMALFVLPSRYLDEPIDAMIYCITVALGFSAMENALFILSPINDGEITKSIITGNMRFVGATLVHVVSSAMIGFMIGLSFYKGAFLKMISIVFGVILATALHASFNLAIIKSTVTGTLKVFGWVWVAVVILIVLFEEIKVVKPKAV